MAITTLPKPWPPTKRLQMARDSARWYRFSATQHRREAVREDRIADRFEREAREWERKIADEGILAKSRAMGGDSE